jgi:hypothetical protein
MPRKAQPKLDDGSPKVRQRPKRIAGGIASVDGEGELHVLPPPVERPDPGTRAWYEMQLADVEAALAQAKPGEVASLHRRIMQYAERIAALRDAETPHHDLTHDELIAKLQAEAVILADCYLEVFVREYTTRNRLKLVRES